jgi:protein gp37
MSDHTNIEWTDATWNPVTGCSLVSPGCAHCYAMRIAGTRLRYHPSRHGLTRDTEAGPMWTGEVRLNEAWLDQPFRWKKPRKIFVCAHGDLFHPAVPDEWIVQVFGRMAMTPRHTYQVLTKRSARMRAFMSDEKSARWPLPNVWLGVSCEDQARADERIPDLRATPAAVRFVSLEPLLGPIDLTAIACPNGCHPPEYCSQCDPDGGEPTGTCDALGAGWIDLVIVGGENGPRPMHPIWPESLLRQCQRARVPFFFKQWGAWAPVCALDDGAIESIYHPAPENAPEATRVCKVASHVLHVDGSEHDVLDPMAFAAGKGAMTMFRVGKRAAGRRLYDRTWDEMPETAHRPRRLTGSDPITDRLHQDTSMKVAL